MTLEYTSVDDLKEKLRITGNELNELLDLYLHTAELVCKQILGLEYIIKPGADITEYQDGDTGQILYLRGYPISSFTSLKVNDEVIPAYTVYGTTGYVVNNTKKGIIKLTGYTLTKGFLNVEIVYLPGWEDKDDIQQKTNIWIAAMRVGASLWNQRDVEGMEVQSSEGLVRKMIAMKDKTLLQLLYPHRRRRIR